MTDATILRRWRGEIRTVDADEYVAYVAKTGMDDYAGTPGNLGAEMLLRDLGDGRTEVTTLSWWRAMEDIVAFAGEPVDLARYYPDDDRFLLSRPERVEHHRVMARGGAP